jgi:hypothetical protein
MPGLSALASVVLDDDGCMEVITLKDHAETPSASLAERGIRYGRKPRRSTVRRLT